MISWFEHIENIKECELYVSIIIDNEVYIEAFWGVNDD